LKEFEIPQWILFIVDLYSFEKTVAKWCSGRRLLFEKIDIGGISLIRAAAKNYQGHPCVFLHVTTTTKVLEMITKGKEALHWKTADVLLRSLSNVSSHYDSAIFNVLIRIIEEGSGI